MYYDIIKSGKRIKELRKCRNMTQEQFAEKLGMSVKTVAKIEAGTNGTTVETLLSMANVLGTTIGYLAVGEATMMNQRLVEAFESIPSDKQELALKILEGIIEKI